MDEMMQKGQITMLAERIEIAERASAGESSPEIAAAMGRPVSTVRKWRHKYQREGRAGLSSQMGRPAAGALAQSSAEIKAAILEMREQQPGWGAQTIRLERAKDKRFADQKLPSRSRIAAFLKERQKVRKYERREELPEPEKQPLERPHQEWELDAHGVTTVAGVGKVSVINVLDVCSHISIDSHACLHTRHPKAAEYQRLLRRAFVRYGLPEQISLDHDSAFYDNKSASPFPSRIHLWLLALGVQVRFIHKPPPLEHAHIERQHQTVAWQAFEGQIFEEADDLQRQLQARILFLNQEYPTSALNGQPPFLANPQARHSGRIYQRQTEDQLLNLQRVYDYLKDARWFRKVSFVGTFSLGGLVYNASTTFAEQTLEITFDPATHMLICLPEKCETAFHLPVKGLTKSALRGNATDLAGFIDFQLVLPLAYPTTTL
jgi:transposase